MTITAGLAIVAGVLGVIEAVKTRGQSLSAWAVLVLALGVYLAH